MGVLANQNRASYLGQQYAPVFSPDGQQIAFVWNGEKQDNYDIYVKVIGTQKLRRITTDSAIDYSPAFSPDGRWIAFCRGNEVVGGTLVIVPTLGGQERIIRKLHTVASPTDRVISWASDGRWLLVTAGINSDEDRVLFLVNPQTGDANRLTNPEPGLVDTYPSVSPDGRFAAFVRDMGRGISTIYIAPFEPLRTALPQLRPLRLPGFERVYVGAPAWMPDSRQLVFESNRGGLYQLWTTPIDGSKPPLLLNSLSDSAHTPAISTTGEFVYVRDTAVINIWKVSLEKRGNGTRTVGAIERVVGSTRQESTPSVSPDGKKLTFASNRSGYGEIWISDVDGQNQTQLTWINNPSTGSPAWSPDGRKNCLRLACRG